MYKPVFPVLNIKIASQTHSILSHKVDTGSLVLFAGAHNLFENGQMELNKC